MCVCVGGLGSRFLFVPRLLSVKLKQHLEATVIQIKMPIRVHNENGLREMESILHITGGWEMICKSKCLLCPNNNWMGSTFGYQLFQTLISCDKQFAGVVECLETVSTWILIVTCIQYISVLMQCRDTCECRNQREYCVVRSNVAFGCYREQSGVRTRNDREYIPRNDLDWTERWKRLHIRNACVTAINSPQLLHTKCVWWSMNSNAWKVLA